MDYDGEKLFLSDAWLSAHTMDRNWAQNWWATHCPGAKEFSDPLALTNSDPNNFWNMVLDIQRLVFEDIDHVPTDEVDGLLGPMTLTRMFTYEESLKDCPDGEYCAELENIKPSEHVVFAGKKVPVDGVKIVSFDEPESLSILEETKRRYGRVKGCKPWPGEIHSLIENSKKYASILGFLHWDAGWSAPGAFRTLVKRKLGTCIGVDRIRKSDGAVIAYQWLDPGLYLGFHGGNAANRRAVVSFDLSNAVYLKYAKKYEKICGVPRPEVRLPFRKKGGHLGMYADQILTTLRILKAISGETGLPLMFPQRSDGRPVVGNWADLWKGFGGVATHENLPKTSKWDIRCFQEQLIVLLLKRPSLQEEFPGLREVYRLDDSWCQKLMDFVEENWKWAELDI